MSPLRGNLAVGRTVTVAVAVVTVASMLFIGAAGASAAKVKVKNYKFSPGTVKIHKGDTVVWKFVQGKHNVKGSGFKSRAKRSGKYRHKFKQKGTFRYRCTLHQGMNGKVKVK